MKVKTREAGGYTRVPVMGMTGGVDLRLPASLLPLTRAHDLVNFKASEEGVLAVRPGYVAVSTGAASTGRFKAAARIYYGGSTIVARTYVGIEGSIYTASSAAPQLVSGSSGLSTTATMYHFIHDRKLSGVLDGTTNALVGVGTVWTKMGIPAGAAPALSSLSTGGLSSGEYEISYTYRSRFGGVVWESNGPAGSTITLSASSGAINVVIPNSTLAQVTALVVYARKVSAGETVLRKVSSLSSPWVSPNSTVVVTSTNWTTAQEIPTTHNPPPALSFGCVWKRHWWARSETTPTTVVYSELDLPQAWPTTFTLEMPFGLGDEIRAIVPMGDVLAVLGTKNIFLISGQTASDFEVRLSEAQDGALGPRAVAVLTQGLVHAGQGGVYLFNGIADRPLSLDIKPAWEDFVANTPAAELLQTPIVADLGQKELRIAVARRYPTTARGEWVLDLTRFAAGDIVWTATDRDIVGYVALTGPEPLSSDRLALLSWPSTSLQLFRESIGTSANSSALTAQYVGPSVNLGAGYARWVDLRVDYEPSSGVCQFGLSMDGISVSSQTVTINRGTPGTDRRQAVALLPLSASGRTGALNLIYQGVQAFRWFGYHLGIVPEPRSRSFSE